MVELNRRTFLATSAAATAALTAHRVARAAATSPNEKVVFAIMGANNRGSQLAKTLAKLPNAEIAYICDCEENAIAKGIEAATSNGGPAPKGIKDFRKALDDKHVDALICAAPNHWHATATLLGLAAGKHVYCEKPASHTPEEGERMIAAAKKSDRVLEIGLQRRSHPQYQHVIDQVRSGAIGKLMYAKSTYYNNRPSIGRGKEVAPPASLDYDLWQGPVTAQPYRDNLIPYNWHLFWHYGNSEVGNNGVHTIDICRWALGVDYPTHVVASGGKFRYDDDEETPDTCNIVADFEGGRTLVWEGVSWSPPYKPLSGINIELRGDAGAIFFEDYYYRRFDADRKLVEEIKKGNNSWQPHLENFIAAIRSGTKLNCGIEDGHKSTMLAHLGNIAYRTGQPLDIDPSNGHIKNNSAADKYWASEYRKGWLPTA
jgi:predicted dehydrogenase